MTGVMKLKWFVGTLSQWGSKLWACHNFLLFYDSALPWLVHEEDVRCLALSTTKSKSDRASSNIVRFHLVDVFSLLFQFSLLRGIYQSSTFSQVTSSRLRLSWAGMVVIHWGLLWGRNHCHANFNWCYVHTNRGWPGKSLQQRMYNTSWSLKWQLDSTHQILVPTANTCVQVLNCKYSPFSIFM